MEYRIEQDVSGASWIVCSFDNKSKRDNERWALRRLHKISHHPEGALDVAFVAARGTSTYGNVLHVSKQDASKFLDLLFPQRVNDGPYR